MEKLENFIIKIDQLTFIHSQQSKHRLELNKRSQKCLIANKCLNASELKIHSILFNAILSSAITMRHKHIKLVHFPAYLLFMNDLVAISNENNTLKFTVCRKASNSRILTGNTYSKDNVNVASDRIEWIRLYCHSVYAQCPQLTQFRIKL